MSIQILFDEAPFKIELIKIIHLFLNSIQSRLVYA